MAFKKRNNFMRNFEKYFEKQTPQQETEKSEKDIEINLERKKATVMFRNLELNADNLRSPEIRIVVEKQPIELVEGKSYYCNAVFIDKETEKMKNLAAKAEKLLEFPEEERPAKVLEIFRQHMHYAYKEVIEKLSKTDPELARWVAKNTGPDANVNNVPLSQLIEKGYGICKHLAVAYLWLAQKAGLRGVILSADRGVIKNIERSDTKEKLFKSVEIGKPLPAHSWVEIKTKEGRWIPVDPSTNLVGDTEAGLEMFRKANYYASGSFGLDFEALPREKLSPLLTKPIAFPPAEAKGSGIICAELRGIKTKPYSGEATLTIRVAREEFSKEFTGFELDIVEAKPKREYISKEINAEK